MYARHNRSVRPYTPIRIPLDQVEAFASSNGVVANLEAKAASETNGTGEEEQDDSNEDEQEDEEEGGDEEDEDSEDVRFQYSFMLTPA